MKSFEELGVSPALLKGLEELGIATPTRVQEQAIPFLLENGSDLIVQAQTGTGKTAAFGLPLLTKINPQLPEIQALVLAPTRELAKQIAKQLFRFTKHTEKIFAEALCGGEDMDRQITALQRPTHIVVATPGRLMDLFRRGALSLSAVKYVVLDEADEMLNMGFKKELEQILALVRDRRSTWLFSATIPDGIQGLIKEYMSTKAQLLKIDRAHVVNRDISHRYIACARDEKVDLIANFLTKQLDNRGIIFCRTRAGAIELAKQLTQRKFPIDLIHGDLMQKERDKAMRAFKKNRAQFLIATDVAARGIDIDALSFVIHHQLPEQIEYYTHRSGRTGRAGKKGISLVFIDPRERAKIHSLEKELAISFMEWK